MTSIPANTPAPAVASPASRTPPIIASRGNEGPKRDSVNSPTSINPSNTRSTAIEARAVVNRTDTPCRTAYARANSPARTGSRLLAMNPIAVACHSGSNGKRLPPTSRRMSRQRSARSGNVSVASAIVASMSQRLARRRCPTSSCPSTPCSAQARSPSVTTSPTTHAQRHAGTLGVGGGLDGEGNEVADLFDESPERVPRGELGGFTQLLRALQRALAAIQQEANVDDGQFGPGAGRGIPGGGPGGVERRRAGPGRHLGRRGDQLLERRRAHAA